MDTREAIVSYLDSLAESRPNRKGVVGILKLYKLRTAGAILKAANCISLERLIEHLESYGATAAEVMAAIGTMGIVQGSGKELHVSITSQAKRDRVKYDRELDKAKQAEFKFSFYRASGAVIETELPEFEIPTSDTVN